MGTPPKATRPLISSNLRVTARVKQAETFGDVAVFSDRLYLANELEATVADKMISSTGMSIGFEKRGK